MSLTEEKTTTEVLDLDSLGFGIHSDSIVVPENNEGEVRKDFFSSTGMSDNELNQMPPKKVVEEKSEETPSPIPTPEGKEEEGEEGKEKEVLSEEELNSFTHEEEGPKKEVLVSSGIKALVDAGELLLLDEDKTLEEYTEEDIADLLRSNIHNIKESMYKTLPEEMFNGFPEELKQAYNYYANGGTDMKSMFHALAASQEIRDLDPTTEQGQIDIARSFLKATNFGTDDEIENEILLYQDRGDLKVKANQFKPKLDKMGEQIAAQKVREQEARRQKQLQAAQRYQNDVYETIKIAKLGEIELNPDVQNQLYNGLTVQNYPSISGKQTNRFGYLIEKYQFVEPRHDLIAEALWLLEDPEKYREAIKRGAVNQTNEKTFRELKSQQQKTAGTNTAQSDKTKVNKTQVRALPRQRQGFFSRG